MGCSSHARPVAGRAAHSWPGSAGAERLVLPPQQEECEKAYFKMDNVLIDDRRIHVDFSQSVAKIRWKGKGRRLRPRWADANR